MRGPAHEPLTGERMSDVDALVSSVGLGILMEGEVFTRIAPEQELVDEFASGLSSDSISDMCDGTVREF